MSVPKKLSDILRGTDRDGLTKAWAATTPAPEFKPLPPGDYVCHFIDGAAMKAKSTGTLGYKLTFKVIEGDFTGRLAWHELWLTRAALPMTKRDLAKLGVTSLDQLDQPIPRCIRCRVKIVLRRDEAGTGCNEVRSFEVIGIDIRPSLTSLRAYFVFSIVT